MAKSLAVKYRPKNFSDVVEQGSTVAILTNQINTHTIKSAYLFCGGAGTGKTTCARIFANEINNGKGEPIELDAASNNSVDDIRRLTTDAETKSLYSEYKVFIIDECFPANTPIRTVDGDKPISKICVGDIVKGMSGNNKVTHIFKNSVLTERLCCVTINSRKIITTVEHLFFTNHGWVEASQLRKGDVVYGDENLQELWQRVCKTTGQRREILLSQMLNGVCKANTSEKSEESVLPGLREADDSSELLEEKNLFQRVQKQTYYEVQYTTSEYRIWDGVTQTSLRKNEEIKSNAKQGSNSKDADDKREEWNSSSMAYTEGWKREIYNSSDSLVASIRNWLGIGVSDKHKKPELARTSTTLVLQSRPWLFRKETGDRGRWSKPQLETWTIKGCEENTSTTNARVESVEIYKRGNNDELFRGSFTDTELSSGYVTMYDLEVENDHSYFVNDVLVHNCHSLSNQAWQAMLKTLEEPPAKAIFIFCTTNPEKIPATILSRVQRYNFQRISQKGVLERLEYIVDKEGIDCPSIEPLKYIAKIADGGMRDAITLLDKCTSYSNTIMMNTVVEALGVMDYDTMFALVKALVKDASEEKSIEIINKVYADGKDVKVFIKDFFEFVLDMNIFSVTRNFDYVKIPNEWEDVLVSYFDDTHIANNLADLLNDLVKLNASIKWEQNSKAVAIADFILFIESSMKECGKDEK